VNLDPGSAVKRRARAGGDGRVKKEES